MPSKIGNELELFEKSLQGKRIFECDDAEIKQVLRYCMLLVGIRGATISEMSEEEKILLISFVRMKYQYHTGEEIKMAFIKACAGEFDVDARPFENFTCEYIGRIMAAYREWSKEAHKILNQRKRTEDQKYLPPFLEDYNEDNLDLLQYFYDCYLKDEFKIQFIPELSWNKARKIFNIEFTDEKKLSITEQARTMVLDDKKSQLRIHDKYKFSGIVRKLSDEINEIEGLSVVESGKIFQINRFSKAIALREWFGELKKNNVEKLSEYKNRNGKK